MGTHHKPPMIMHIAKEELRQDLIMRIAPKTTKTTVKSLIMLMFILITSTLLRMNIIFGIKKHVVIVACITLWLSSAAREWQ